MRRANADFHNRLRAFTFVEVLAALMFLAILVPAIVGGLTVSSRASEFSTRRTLAAELAENELNNQLIGNLWQSGSVTKGDFGDDHPGYRWEMSQTNWQGDTVNPMTELSMEVFFLVKGAEHSVRLTTLVNPQGQTTAQPTPSPTPTP